MNSNEDKLYIKIVGSNMIYNFAVEKFLNLNRLGPQNIFYKFIDFKI